MLLAAANGRHTAPKGESEVGALEKIAAAASSQLNMLFQGAARMALYPQELIGRIIAAQTERRILNNTPAVSTHPFTGEEVKLTAAGTIKSEFSLAPTSNTSFASMTQAALVSFGGSVSKRIAELSEGVIADVKRSTGSLLGIFSALDKYAPRPV